MQRLKIKNLNSIPFLTFLLMPFFKPASLALIAPTVDIIFDGWRIVSLLIVAGTYLFSVKKPSIIILAITVYEIFLLVSTIINSGDYWLFTVNCVSVLGFSMLTDLCISQNCKKYFKTIFNIYLVLLSIHFVILLLFPDGIAADEYYVTTSIFGFLGTDNGLAVNISLPLMGVACLYSAFRGKKLTFGSLILIALISATMLITWSATGVVAWFVLIMYIFFVYKKPYARFLNSYVLFLTFIILQVSIVFLRLQESFSFIIENILGKSITFTGRTTVWDQTYLIIAESPIIGHGVYNGRGLVYTGSIYLYSHNAVLEILTQGGVVGLVLYAVPFVMAAKKLFANRKHFLAGIVSATIFSFMVDFLMEAPTNIIWVFGYLVIGFNISKIIEQYEAYKSTQNEKRYRLSYPNLKPACER